MRLPTAILLLAPAVAGCRSADSWAEQADEDVYGILEPQLEALSSETGFTIEPPRESLREQLLARSAEQREPVELDLVDCLRVAAENSREWQDQRERLYRAALDLTLERWNFSVQENGTVGAFLSGTGGQAQSEGFLSNLNLFKLLGWGTAITADIGLDLLRDVGTGDGWDAVSNLSLNITQPILRGFGKDIVMEPLTQAERDVVYEARRYERFRRTFAVDIARQFFLVLEQQDRLANEEANYLSRQDLRRRNEALAEAGRQSDIEVDQARQSELSAEDNLVAARRDLQGALDNLKFVLGIPIEIELVLEEGGLRSLAAWRAFELEIPEPIALGVGLERRLDHMTVADQLEDAERRVHVAADALRAGLDFAAGASLSSPEGQPASLRLDDVQWDLALGLDLPIDRLPERNVYRSSLIALEASRRALEASNDGVTSELRDALRRLEAARASYEIQSGSVTLAERRVESAALSQEAGRASTRDVLDSQDSLLSAQNTLAGALTDTILAGLFLFRDMELLEVDASGIVIRQDELPQYEPPPTRP